MRELQPNCLLNGRLGGTGDYRSTGDNRIPDQVVPGVWEVPATVNDTWGYKSYDEHWKSIEDLTFKLVDIVSKGGNYLLNVGPTSEGIIPAESVTRLRAVGRWLKVNGEAIYGASPTPFGQEFGQPSATKKDSTASQSSSRRKIGAARPSRASSTFTFQVAGTGVCIGRREGQSDEGLFPRRPETAEANTSRRQGDRDFAGESAG